VRRLNVILVPGMKGWLTTAFYLLFVCALRRCVDPVLSPGLFLCDGGRWVGGGGMMVVVAGYVASAMADLSRSFGGVYFRFRWGGTLVRA